MLRRIILAALALASPTAAHAQATISRANAVYDHSGTVTTGGTSQIAVAANINRMWLMCQNPISATEPLFVNFGVAASTTGGSVELAPGGVMQFIGAAVPTMNITVTATTSTHRYICKASANQ